MKDFFEFLRNLTPIQTLTALVVVMTVVLLAMVWRAWAFHYPEPAQHPEVPHVPAAAGPLSEHR